MYADVLDGDVAGSGGEGNGGSVAGSASGVTAGFVVPATDAKRSASDGP